MTVAAEVVSVATSPTLVSAATEAYDQSGHSVVVRVPTGGVTVYFGGSDVTTAAGFPVAAGESYAFDLELGDSLYGRVASGTQNVNVLRTGV